MVKKDVEKDFLTRFWEYQAIGLGGNPNNVYQNLEILNPATTNKTETNTTTQTSGNTKATDTSKTTTTSSSTTNTSTVKPASTSGNTQTKAGGTTGSGNTTATSATGTTADSGAKQSTDTGVKQDTAAKTTDADETDWSLGDIWANAYGGINNPYANQGELVPEVVDYLTRSGKQALLGNYSDDVTALGTGVQVLAGILGLDTAADVRDIYYDITHWDGSKEHLVQTLLDVVGLIPIVGAVKYADEIGTLVKQGTKGADEVAEAGTLMKQGTKGGTEADGATKTTVKSASDPDAESEAMAMAAGAEEKRFYDLPPGYKPDPRMTDEEVREFVARGWLPPSPKPSPIATDDELRRMLELEKQEGLAKPLSNGVEEMEDAGIAARNGKGYNGGEGLAEGVGKRVVSNPFNDAGELKPNVKYQTGEFGYKYETDSLGRLEMFQADDLKITQRIDRLPHSTDTPGKLSDDHAGHLAGDRFGGSPDLDNLVSQSANFNLSKYKKIENQWARAITEGKKVQTQVKVKYNNNDSRPAKFIIDYNIEGEYFSQILNN